MIGEIIPDMNKHLSKYLTSDNPILREWVRERIHKTDQKYEVIDRDVRFIPEENQFIIGAIDLSYQKLKQIKAKVIYCRELICSSNQLTRLPELPYCKGLYCSSNQLTQLPKLPYCKELYCRYNQLTSLPELPLCKKLSCRYNQLTSLPDLPVCEELKWENNPGNDWGNNP